MEKYYRKELSGKKDGSPFFLQCRNQALVYLGIREHNRRELITKLKARGYEDSLIEDVIEELVSDGFLSEERYVRSFVRSNNKRHAEGKNLVLQRLAAKGADRAVFQKTVDEIYTDEYTSAIVREAETALLRKGKARTEAELRTALRKLGFSNWDIRDIF